MSDRFFAIAVIAVVIAVPIFAIWGKRAFDRGAAASLEQIYALARRQAQMFGVSAPQVTFRYHTYSGILIYVKQTEHQFRLPYPVARNTLKALLKHTLKYGLFAYSGLVIPVLAYLNYLAQLGSIRKQSESGRVLRR